MSLSRPENSAWPSPDGASSLVRRSAGVRPEPATIWFTGLSGAGKTSVGRETSRLLRAEGLKAALIDGDAVRRTLCADLGFSTEDRVENVRRIGELCLRLNRKGVFACASVISPFEASRAALRRLIPRFVLVHCEASLDVLEARDVKGLYRRARAGELRGFTGIDAPYEPPPLPDLRLRSDRGETPVRSAKRVVHTLRRLGYLAAHISLRVPLPGG
jgi:adenylyl-sulfate kinase